MVLGFLLASPVAATDPAWTAVLEPALTQGHTRVRFRLETSGPGIVLEASPHVRITWVGAGGELGPAEPCDEQTSRSGVLWVQCASAVPPGATHARIAGTLSLRVIAAYEVEHVPVGVGHATACNTPVTIGRSEGALVVTAEKKGAIGKMRLTYGSGDAKTVVTPNGESFRSELKDSVVTREVRWTFPPTADDRAATLELDCVPASSAWGVDVPVEGLLSTPAP